MGKNLRVFDLSEECKESMSDKLCLMCLGPIEQYPVAYRRKWYCCSTCLTRWRRLGIVEQVTRITYLRDLKKKEGTE